MESRRHHFGEQTATYPTYPYYRAQVCNNSRVCAWRRRGVAWRGVAWRGVAWRGDMFPVAASPTAVGPAQSGVSKISPQKTLLDSRWHAAFSALHMVLRLSRTTFAELVD